MSWENEAAELRFEIEKLKRRRDQGEEIKQQIWNNMQEDIHRLCQENHEQLGEFRAETGVKFEQLEGHVDQRFEQQGKQIERLESKVDQKFEQMDQRIGRLEADVSTLKSDVSTMKSDISDIKAILLNKR